MNKYILICLCVVSAYAQEQEPFKEQVERFEQEKKCFEELIKRGNEREKEIELIEQAGKKKKELELKLERLPAAGELAQITRGEIAQQEKIIEKGEQLKIEQKKSNAEAKISTRRLALAQAELAKSVKSFERDLYTSEQIMSLVERIRKDMYSLHYDAELWKEKRKVLLEKGFSRYSGKEMEEFVHVLDVHIKTSVSLVEVVDRYLSQSQRSIFAKFFEYFCLRITSLVKGESFYKLQKERMDFEYLQEAGNFLIKQAGEMIPRYGSEHIQRVLASDKVEVDRLTALLSKTREDIDPIWHDTYKKALETARTSVQESLKLRKYALIEEINHVAYKSLTPLAQAVLILSVDPRNKAALAYVSSLKISGPELRDIIPLSASADEAIGQLLSVERVGDPEQAIKDLEKQLTPNLMTQFRVAKSKADKAAEK